MNERSRPRHDGEVLSEAVTTRVLARASELDAARATGATVSELRAAAAEAGISAAAFEAALAEVQGAESQPVARVEARPRRRLGLWATSVALIALLAGVFVSMRVVPNVASVAGTVEQTFTLRCLSSAQAADLIRPLLQPANTLVFPPDSRMVIVRARQAQMEVVRAALDRAEREAPACPTAP
ncbi:MAG TPA: hypothetical protein VFT29_10180 [Gemmatimonadaceae bacterium]|nr:hypothetical protein [Gemmatimonadaceae bacterium]